MNIICDFCNYSFVFSALALAHDGKAVSFQGFNILSSVDMKIIKHIFPKPLTKRFQASAEQQGHGKYKSASKKCELKVVVMDAKNWNDQQHKERHLKK